MKVDVGQAQEKEPTPTPPEKPSKPVPASTSTDNNDNSITVSDGEVQVTDGDGNEVRWQEDKKIPLPWLSRGYKLIYPIIIMTPLGFECWSSSKTPLNYCRIPQGFWNIPGLNNMHSGIPRRCSEWSQTILNISKFQRSWNFVQVSSNMNSDVK